MKKKICIIFSLFLSLFISIGHVLASSTELKNMTIQAFIKDDGSAHIQEIWDMDVNEGTEVYKVFNQMGESQITNLQVTDENGLKYQNIRSWDVDASRKEKKGKCGLVTKSDGYELCFGIGDYGERTYTFEYDVTNFVKEYTDGKQGFNYAFFSNLALTPKNANVTISSDHAFTDENTSIWAFGYDGSVIFEDGKIVMKTDGKNFRGTKMQLVMSVLEHTFSQSYMTSQSFADVLSEAKTGSDYDDTDETSQRDNNLGIMTTALIFGTFAIVAVFVFATSITTKKGEKMKYTFSDGKPLDKKNVNMFRDIPCDKDIFKFYFIAMEADLIDEKDRGGFVGAILLRWVQQGYIVFEKTEESHLMFFKKDGFSIDLDKELPITHPLELKLLGFIRNAAGSNKKLETKEFEKWCSSHYEDIDEWFRQILASSRVKYQDDGLIKTEQTYTRYMGIKIKRYRDVYDISIREEMEHVIGLKKFLQEMSLIDEKEVIEVKMWEEYLIFASILGIADKVSEQLGDLCPTFNQESHLDTVYTMHMIHMFAYDSMRASRSAAMAAQEARSGGFGGGASFGGGGGGFSGGGGGGVR